MCGLAGIIDPGAAPDPVRIGAMIAAMPYRGPDGAGQKCFEPEGVALGHLRLSILDLSSAGAQPMASEDGLLWLIHNGEVYNYLEIRRELESLGWKFRTGTDTEVVLASYRQWGAECVKRFMGMYAFAIWDRGRRELFIARDRLGIKPMYFTETPGGGLLFASEIKAILAARPGAGAVDVPLIDAYMNFGYVPGEETLHRGIRRLLPGHTLHWRDGRCTVTRYWDLGFSPDGGRQSADFDESILETRRMFEESVALHLRSDVPLGVFLSGGLDSSAVVAMLSRDVSRNLNTFSVAYDFGPDYDETPYAREVARTFGTDHHEVRVTPQQFMDFVPDFIWHMDEPVTEAAAISLYFVSKLARERVVVCLSGEGADELFAGYDFYVYNLAIERARNWLGGGLFRGLAKWTAKARRLRKLHKYLALAGQPLASRYRGISSYEPAREDALYSGGFAARAAQGAERCAPFIESLLTRSRDWDPLSRMLYFDTRTWLVDDLLIKADRMSMANSIELRVPFLDHRLVEHAARLPADFKIRRGDTKFILKRCLAGRLPDRILRRRKMGFPAPLAVMLRGPLFDYVRELLLSREATGRGYFESHAVARLLTDHQSGRADNHRRIWQLAVLEEWHRRFAY